MQRAGVERLALPIAPVVARHVACEAGFGLTRITDAHPLAATFKARFEYTSLRQTGQHPSAGEGDCESLFLPQGMMRRWDFSRVAASRLIAGRVCVAATRLMVVYAPVPGVSPPAIQMRPLRGRNVYKLRTTKMPLPYPSPLTNSARRYRPLPYPSPLTNSARRYRPPPRTLCRTARP